MAGEMPRYSASDRPEVRPCVEAQNSPSTSRQAKAAIVERPGDALRHQIDDVEPFCHLAEIAFRCPDDRRAAALNPLITRPPPV